MFWSHHNRAHTFRNEKTEKTEKTLDKLSKSFASLIPDLKFT